MAILASIWTSLLGMLPNLESLAVTDIPSLLTSLFSGAGISAGEATTLWGQVQALATNALGNLGRAEYVRACIKSFTAICNKIPAGVAVSAWQVTCVTMTAQLAALYSRQANNWAALAYFQPTIGPDEAAGGTAADATHAGRDSINEDIESTENLIEMALQGNAITIPPVPAAVTAALAAIQAMGPSASAAPAAPAAKPAAAVAAHLVTQAQTVKPGGSVAVKAGVSVTVLPTVGTLTLEAS